MREAQINSQVFVYILAIIVTAIILLYGYSAVRDMREKGKLTELILFKSNLKTAINIVRNEYGSFKVQSINLPSGYRKVCFVDLEFGGISSYPNLEPLIRNRVADVLDSSVNAEPMNVFLCPPCIQQDYVGKIGIKNDDSFVGFKCFEPSRGAVKIRIDGLGDRAIIS